MLFVLWFTSLGTFTAVYIEDEPEIKKEKRINKFEEKRVNVRIFLPLGMLLQFVAVHVKIVELADFALFNRIDNKIHNLASI